MALPCNSSASDLNWAGISGTSGTSSAGGSGSYVSQLRSCVEARVARKRWQSFSSLPLIDLSLKIGLGEFSPVNEVGVVRSSGDAVA